MLTFELHDDVQLIFNVLFSDCMLILPEIICLTFFTQFLSMYNKFGYAQLITYVYVSIYTYRIQITVYARVCSESMVRKTIFSLSCLSRNDHSVVLETVTVLVLLTVALTHPFSVFTCYLVLHFVLQVSRGVHSSALVHLWLFALPQLMSAAHQHFGFSEMQVTCDVCFTGRLTRSVLSLSLSTSRIVDQVNNRLDGGSTGVFFCKWM